MSAFRRGRTPRDGREQASADLQPPTGGRPEDDLAGPDDFDAPRVARCSRRRLPLGDPDNLAVDVVVDGDHGAGVSQRVVADDAVGSPLPEAEPVSVPARQPVAAVMGPVDVPQIVVGDPSPDVEPVPIADRFRTVPFRPDTVIDGWSSQHLTVRGASLRGHSHRYDGMPREDDFAVHLLADGRVIILVADGVSAATQSHIGATQAVRYATQWLESKLADQTEDTDWSAMLKEVAYALSLEAQKILGLDSPDPHKALDVFATTLVCAVVDPRDSAEARVFVVGVGDSQAWVLREGEFVGIVGGKAVDEGGISSSAVDPLPRVPHHIQPEIVEILPGDVLMVGTDGIGDPLGGGQGGVGNLFRQLFSKPTPPSLIEFAHAVDFSRETFDDDRTLVAVSMRGELDEPRAPKPAQTTVTPTPPAIPPPGTPQSVDPVPQQLATKSAALPRSTPPPPSRPRKHRSQTQAAGSAVLSLRQRFRIGTAAAVTVLTCAVILIAVLVTHRETTPVASPLPDHSAVPGNEPTLSTPPPLRSSASTSALLTSGPAPTASSFIDRGGGCDHTLRYLTVRSNADGDYTVQHECFSDRQIQDFNRDCVRRFPAMNNCAITESARPGSTTGGHSSERIVAVRQDCLKPDELSTTSEHEIPQSCVVSGER